MTRDLAKAIANLTRHRQWAERAREFAAGGDAELIEATERAIRTGSRVLQRIVQDAANDEADGKWN